MSKENKVLAAYRARFDGNCFADCKRVGIYANLIQLIGAEQFNWKNLPDTINSHWTERAVNTGLALAYKVPDTISSVNKGFTITPCAFSDVINNIGMSDRVITYGTDYSLEFDLKKDADKCVLIKNNDYMYSEYPNLLWFAEMLARTDASEKALIIWSKVHPIAKATTGIESAKLTAVLKAIIEDDDLFSVISDNSKVVTGTPNSRDDSVLRLTDENSVDKMHFLSESHYELIRRYCTLYNMPFRTNSKSAQSLESELHNTDIFSQIINENRLKCRQDAAKEINEKFGFDISVDYSELLKKENKIIDSNIQEEVNEAKMTDENVSHETIDNPIEKGEDNETDNDNSTD